MLKFDLTKYFPAVYLSELQEMNFIMDKTKAGE